MRCAYFPLSCSPRDFLTRRLAADLIAASDTFRAPQHFQLRTGVISNEDYLSPDYLVLQHRGWISGTKAACPPALVPPPCWDVTLTPSGVDTFQSLIAPGEADKQLLNIPAVRRELIGVTGISKQGEHRRRRIRLEMGSRERSWRGYLPGRSTLSIVCHVSLLR